MSKLEVKPGMFSSVESKPSLKNGITMTAFAAVILTVFGFMGNTQSVTFQLSDAASWAALPDVVLRSSDLGIWAGFILLALAAGSLALGFSKRQTPRYLIAVFALIAITALLGWIAAGNVVPVSFILGNMLVLAIPIILGGMGGIMSERVGVVNIAIEGQLLTGAFMASVIGSITGSLWLGLITAMITAAILSMVLASLAVKYLVDQVIIGVLLNVLVIGVTNFLYSQVLSENQADLNFPGTFNKIAIPFLSQLPIIGDAFFNRSIIVYLTYLIVPAIWFMLFRTRLGLRARSVGEHPLAADTVGINVARTRFWWVTIGGAIAGLGGAAITIGNVGAFGREMTGGQGFIALAVVILGRWQPIYVSISALLFGFAIILRIWANQVNPGIPVDFITMVPYLVTLIAVAGFAGRVRAPAADGQPYEKG